MNYLQKQIDKIDEKIKETEEMLSNPELTDLAQQDIRRLKNEREFLKKAGKAEVINRSSSDRDFNKRNVILQIQGAAGGEEAKIWAQDLLRMYTRYATNKNWRIESIDESSLKLSGKGAYGLLKLEAGVHRVQRIPVTESSGRIHTSTATVAVLPELEDIDFHINPDDVEFEAFRSSGHGGQNVNKVSTAVRLKHNPTGMVVECQSERHQAQNRKIAMQMLRAKLWEIEKDKRQKEISEAKREQVGRGMRAEKIRTYNFLQDRVTDHRIQKSWHHLEAIVEGNLDKIVNELKIKLEE